MERSFHKIIRKICEELNIKYTVLSKDWILMLEYNGITRFISGFKFDLNGHALGNVIDDKYALYEVLKAKGIPVVEHKIMFRPNNENEYALENNTYDVAKKYFEEHGRDIVVKANNGTCGNEVFHITSYEALLEKLNVLFESNFSISLCPYYKIETEYRVILLNGEIMYSYGKKRPILVGDGVKTIKDLLFEFNSNYFQKDDAFFNKEIDINYVPKDREVVEYNWQFNLSKGSQIIDIGEAKEEVTRIAKDVYSAIGLGFGSVDVVKTNSGFYVLESNSGVMMENLLNLIDNGFEIVYNTYLSAVKAMFNID